MENKALLKEPVDSIALVQIYSKLKFYFNNNIITLFL